jgi:hypothetical protein
MSALRLLDFRTLVELRIFAGTRTLLFALAGWRLILIGFAFVRHFLSPLFFNFILSPRARLPPEL